jgi:integrase
MNKGLYFDMTEAENTTLYEALDRYAKEITPTKKEPSVELGRIRTWQKHKLAQYSLAVIRGKDLAAYRDQRIDEGKAANTIRLELTIISHLYTIAKKEWGMENLVNPVSNIRLPTLPAGRDRRLEGDEEERLLQAAEQSRSRVIKPIIILALETAARRIDLAEMKWKYINFNSRTWFIPDSKTPLPQRVTRYVPLSTTAIAILKKLRKEVIRIDGSVFSVKEHSITQAFGRCRKKAKIKNFHFHDLRHEATSRLFEKGLNMMEVASITGHKDLKMLRRYTHLRAEDLALKLG